MSVGPPGNFAVLIGEEALFGTGSEGSGIVMFDFQFGGGLRATRSKPEGIRRHRDAWSRTSLRIARQRFERPLHVGGHRNLGARGSVPWSSTNIWLGADLPVRSSDSSTGGPSPVSHPQRVVRALVGVFFPGVRVEQALFIEF